MKKVVIFALIIISAANLFASNIVTKFLVPVSNSIDHSTASIINTESDTVEYVDGFKYTAICAAYSYDGKYAYVSNNKYSDNTTRISVVDLETDTIVNAVTWSQGNGDYSYSIVLDYINDLLYLNTRYGTHMLSVDGPNLTYKGKIFSQDSNQKSLEGLAVVDGNVYILNSDKLIIYNSSTKETTVTANPNSQRKWKFLCPSSDGSYIVITSDVGYPVQKYDIATGTFSTFEIKDETDTLCSVWVDFSKDGRYIYGVEQNKFFKYDTETKVKTSMSLGSAGNNPYGFGMTEDQKYAYILDPYGSNHGNVHVVKIEDNFSDSSVVKSYYGGNFSDGQLGYVGGSMTGYLLPNTYGYFRMREKLLMKARFNFNGKGTDFSIPLEENESVLSAATAANPNYELFSYAAKKSVSNWDTLVTNAYSTGYVIEGWYLDTALTTKADFSAKLTTNTDYYAKWVAHTHNWNFYKEGYDIKAYCSESQNSSLCRYQGKNNSITLSVMTANHSVLDFNILPLNATLQTLTWTSTDNDIVSVDDNGIVAGLKAGSATIQAASVDGSGVHSTLSVVTVQ